MMACRYFNLHDYQDIKNVGNYPRKFFLPFSDGFGLEKLGLGSLGLGTNFSDQVTIFGK